MQQNHIYQYLKLYQFILEMTESVELLKYHRRVKSFLELVSRYFCWRTEIIKLFKLYNCWG